MAIKVTVQLVVFAIRDSALQVLLAKRQGKTLKNGMGIPGTLLHQGESFEDAAKRTLKSSVGADEIHLEQLHCSVNARRNGGGGRGFSVAYFALLPADKARAMSSTSWRGLRNLSTLGSTQQRIVDHAVRRLRKRVEHNTAGFRLLARKFTLPELQQMYEAILDRDLDKRNFRKKMSSLGVLRALPEWRRTGRKPARLYTVAASRLEKLEHKEIAL
ncbi:MAG TPA: NUDIX domain-containing protein [Candidatus Angelobacter sp.]|nr:NUDIX domain-containing protein [Candidatus Angelobacter sp.]